MHRAIFSQKAVPTERDQRRGCMPQGMGIQHACNWREVQQLQQRGRVRGAQQTKQAPPPRMLRPVRPHEKDE
jgi:hypothetical protein